ncbi:hypothetical protein QJS04_geneDACA003958 [Acorus gramineus]|uniref:Uncharacterized protein n=1 Tax=Acorus gramineus TaxID=55184 RepID=A0AAV9BJ44_ACOGR|nr:hypothetical protein QJS04_geneDACA003958 [Acorus gramineus]
MADPGIYLHPPVRGTHFTASSSPYRARRRLPRPSRPRLGPYDVKEREIQNLLQWIPSFEASHVYSIWEKPMGYALFSTALSTITAKDALQVQKK